MGVKGLCDSILLHVPQVYTLLRVACNGLRDAQGNGRNFEQETEAKVGHGVQGLEPSNQTNPSNPLQLLIEALLCCMHGLNNNIYIKMTSTRKLSRDFSLYMVEACEHLPRSHIVKWREKHVAEPFQTPNLFHNNWRVPVFPGQGWAALGEIFNERFPIFSTRKSTT